MPIVSTTERAFDVDVVVFDKDGTLVDLDAVWFPPAQGWVEAVASGDTELADGLSRLLGIDLPGRRLVPDGIAAASTFGDIRSTTAGALAARSWQADRIAAALDRAAAAVDGALRSAEPVLLADVPALFSSLTAGGLQLALLTSDDRQPTLDFLGWLGADHLLDMVVTASDVEHPKPHPDGLQRIADGLSLPTDRILMVGDSVFDHQAARAAGAWFVSVGRDTGASKLADASVDCIDQLTVG
jgi:phosphoglycolate phosphatase